MPQFSRSILFSKDVVWVVEARQLTGGYEPIAAPTFRPFGRAQALAIMNAIAQAMPDVASRLRVWPYAAMDPESFDAKVVRYHSAASRKQKKLLHPGKVSPG